MLSTPAGQVQTAAVFRHPLFNLRVNATIPQDVAIICTAIAAVRLYMPRQTQWAELPCDNQPLAIQHQAIRNKTVGGSLNGIQWHAIAIGEMVFTAHFTLISRVGYSFSMQRPCQSPVGNHVREIDQSVSALYMKN